MANVLRSVMASVVAAALLAGVVAPAWAGPMIHVKDIAKVQGMTSNQLVGYGVVVGLAGTGDSTSVIFTSQTIQNILESFGLTVSQQAVRTRDVAAVIVTSSLPAFAHSGDHTDVTVSAMGDATSLQGGTLVMTELKGANNLVYATAQGPISVGGFSAGVSGASVQRNYTLVGRVPNGGIIARDMTTTLMQDATGFNYVLTTPDFRTAANLATALNGRFGYGTAYPVDAETIHVTLPANYKNQPVYFLADAGDLSINQGQLAKVILNERTGTIVFGGDIKLAPCAIAHGNLTITIATNNKVNTQPFTTVAPPVQTNTKVTASEGGKKLVFLAGSATLASVVNALNTMGVSPRDLIAIVQALRQAGSLQADVEIQ